MKKWLLLLPLVLLTLSACREKRYFTEVPGDVYLAQIVFEDNSFRDFTVVSDVLYAGEDTTSHYKMVFYMPEGWDDSYPIFLDRYVPLEFGQAWTAYQGRPAAEAALSRGDMIVVLVAYEEQTAISDILLAEYFLKEHDADLPGDSKQLLTPAYFDFE